MTEFLTKLSSLFLALICTIIPNMNYEAKDSESILLNVALISDVHYEPSIFTSELMLTNALKDIKNNATENDAIVVAGDLTNNGDEELVGEFYEIMKANSPADEWIIAAGNHDIGHADDTNAKARKWLIKYYNEYTNSDTDKIYYAKTIDGYRFIVLADESKNGWDLCHLSDKQLKFLDTELKKATKNGKPAFVVCHWPVERTNGQTAVYRSGECIEGDYAKKITDIMEKYKNVFFITGHMHKGLNGEIFDKVFGFSSVETIRGVNYVNIPAFGTANRYGIPWNGTGLQMEVYEDEVVFRGRHYSESRWYAFTEYTVPIVK